MNTGKTTTKLFALAIALVAAAAICFAWGARQAQANQGSEDFLPYIETIGIAAGQTARLNAFNSGEDRGIVINWRFLDSQGRILGQSPERLFIPPGQLRSFDLNADTINSTRDPFGRVQVIAIIRTLGGPDTKNLYTSLEVFDNTTS